jgi:hypothetical protein
MKKILLSASVFVLSISLMAQNSALLKLNLEKNKVYRLRSLSEQTVSQTINGNQQTVDSKVGHTISLKMIDRTPDFMVTEVHFDTLFTKTNSMGKITTFSSAVEGNIKSSEMGDIMSCLMNRLSKNALYVKLDFTGKPVEIINQKMLSDIVLKDTSSITLAGIMGSAVKKQVGDIVSDNNLKTTIGMFTWNLPGKEVAAGETWTTTQQTNSGGMELTIKNSYRLDAIKGDNAEITAESSIKAADNASPIKSAGATVTYDNLMGVGKSNIVIDTRTGLIVSAGSKTHITGNLGISAPGVSMQMPMDINSESNIKSVE